MCLPRGLLTHGRASWGHWFRARGQHRLRSSIPRECVLSADRECRKRLTCALTLEAPRAPGQGSEFSGLLLLLSCFSRVQLCDPIDGSPQAPLSLGFSRQEYCSGLLFPSPMHACMLNRFSHVRLCATPWTAAHQAPLSTGFSRQELEWVVLSYL